MAISASTVWEVRTAGSDTNGGGYVSGGTDYSQQDAKNTVGSNISTTDAVAAGTTTITSATAAFTTAITGNIVYFQGGTGTITAQWRQATFVNSTSITIDTAIAASTGMTMNIGGALGSPGQAAANKIAGNTVYVKAGTYSITSASTNISGGCVSEVAAGSARAWEGYSSSRGDMGTAPIFQASGISTATIFLFSTSGSPLIRNITVDGASLTSVKGFSIARRGTFQKLSAINCTNIGIDAGITGAELIGCRATNTTGGTAGIVIFSGVGCESYANTVPGFVLSGSSGGQVVLCIADGNTGASSDGFLFGAGAEQTLYGCVSYNNGRDGFRNTAAEPSTFINCIAEGNSVASAVGFNATSAAIGAGMIMINCAYYNNTTNVSANVTGANNNPVLGTSTFFVNAGSRNFSLNTVSTGGSLVRSSGYLGTFPSGSSIGYSDIGAAQHQAPAFQRPPGMLGGMSG